VIWRNLRQVPQGEEKKRRGPVQWNCAVCPKVACVAKDGQRRGDRRAGLSIAEDEDEKHAMHEKVA
jgi:hypothetical protein